MRTDTRPIEITIADLQADVEGIIRSLPESGGTIIISESGAPIAWLAPLSPSEALTPEQVREILQSSMDAEHADPSILIAHEDFMRELEEDEERQRASS